MHRFVGVLGLITMMTLAWFFSTNRGAIRGKTVAWGLGLQILFAFLVLHWSFGQWLLRGAARGGFWVLGFSVFGSSFISGVLGQKGGSPLPGSTFAFFVLPAIRFLSAIFASLNYLGEL